MLLVAMVHVDTSRDMVCHQSWVPPGASGGPHGASFGIQGDSSSSEKAKSSKAWKFA